MATFGCQWLHLGVSGSIWVSWVYRHVCISHPAGGYLWCLKHMTPNSGTIDTHLAMACRLGGLGKRINASVYVSMSQFKVCSILGYGVDFVYGLVYGHAKTWSYAMLTHGQE